MGKKYKFSEEVTDGTTRMVEELGFYLYPNREEVMNIIKKGKFKLYKTGNIIWLINAKQYYLNLDELENIDFFLTSKHFRNNRIPSSLKRGEGLDWDLLDFESIILEFVPYVDGTIITPLLSEEIELVLKLWKDTYTPAQRKILRNYISQ